MQDYLLDGFQKIDSDLKFLISCFREVLEELGQSELAAALPWDEIPGPQTHPARLGQAFSVAFQLLNLVEENTAAQTRRAREKGDGMAAERGLWGHALKKLEGEGISPSEIAEILPQICVEPVLTAHPTEAKRLTVLEAHRELFRALGERENPLLTDSEQGEIRRRIKAILERLWRTGEILLAKPDISDERRNVLHYLQHIFPDVLLRLEDRLQSAWSNAKFPPELLQNGPQTRFGTWVGGDRDGHTGVTAEVTRDTLRELRLGAFLVFQNRLDDLAAKMSLSIYGQKPPQILLDGIARLSQELNGRARPILAQDEEEPWRQFARLMAAKIPVEIADDRPILLRDDGRYRFPHQLDADLQILGESLDAVGAHRLNQSEVLPLRRALETFGFHLADLDIRQNSAFHDKALSQLMVAAGLDGADWPQRSEEARLRFLNQELRSPRPFLPPGALAGTEAEAVLSCYRVLVKHLERCGGGLGALIISMTRQLSDLLVVFLLAREAGLTRQTENGLVCALPIVPLFETVDDLERSPAILRAFLEHPVARNSLDRQNPAQQVMIGYSDSNKDLGIFAAQWGLEKGQRAMAEVGQETGVKIRFFHGRGGTISRGAGPTHRFLEALPHGSLSGDIRLTEQGETIAQKFGNRATATYNLELLLAGVTANTLRGKIRTEVDGSRGLENLADKMAQTSGRAYRALLENPNFIPFFRQATPIDALENARIGSRPARRTGQASLADLRAIPWVFSWNQSRFYLPGWFGIGTALESLEDAEFEALKRGLANWKWLRYVLTNVETNLASTDFELMRAYSELVEETAVRDEIFGLIAAEWQRTGAQLERLAGGAMDSRRPRMLKTLQIRARALEVLHRQQIELLRAWRASEQNEALLPELLLSINAIASGLRTTG